MQPTPDVPRPRVSVGVPVYNGERYVARTLESLLRQTYTDFELIVTDNGSTDATESICRDFASRDGRICYVRAPGNEGIVRNFNKSVELARGEYFKWNAADDTVDPTFIEKCVAVLDADPSVVVAFTRSMIIDEEDRPKRVNDYDARADDPRAGARFSALINLNHRRHSAQEIYGVIRRAALLRTTLYEPIVRTDSILLARLAIMGRFRCVEEPLFFNREHEQRSVRLVPGETAVTRSRLSKWIGIGPVPPAEFWDRSLAGRIIFPEWRILRAYVESLKLAPRTPRDWLACRVALAWFAVKHTPKLGRDVVIAAEHALLGYPGSKKTSEHHLAMS